MEKTGFVGLDSLLPGGSTPKLPLNKEFQVDEKKLNEEELAQASGGKQAARAEIDGDVSGKKTRPTREGKLTFRRADNPQG